MINSPLVSVILPVYNSEKYVYEALLSIVNQSYTNIEIIIVVNGTTDNSLTEISKIEDHRIKIIEIKEAIGLVRALNIGIEQSNGVYIARMDADDIAFKSKIQKQINFLEKNLNYGLCATWYEAAIKTFDGPTFIRKNKVEDQDIKLKLLYQCHVCHPTVIIRKSLLDKFNLKYSLKFPHAEDYGLWVEMSDKTKFYTYPEVLFQYRHHDESISNVESDSQQQLSLEIRKDYFKKIGCNFNIEEIKLYSRFVDGDFLISVSEIKSINSILTKLLTHSNENVIKRKNLTKYHKLKWNALIANSNCSKKELNIIHKNSFVSNSINTFIDNLKLKFSFL